MDRRRTVTTAAGLSAVLVAGGAAVASANGLFGAGRAQKVGSFSAVRGRLVPVDSLLSPPTPSTSTSLLAPPTTEREAPTTATPEPEPSDDTPTSAPVVSPASSTTVSRSAPSALSGEHESDDGSDSSGVESDD